MLNQTMCVGDISIPGIFISTEKDLEREWKKYKEQAVYLTEQPGLLRKIKQLGGASLYLEKAQQESCSFTGDADYIWQMEEDTDLPDQRYLYRIWQRHMHLPWLIAETNRLIIRESVMEDLPYFQKFYEEEKENSDVQEQGSLKEMLQNYITKRYPLFEYGLWTIVDKRKNVVIGRAGIEELPEHFGNLEGEPELSYLIGSKYRQKGYATEACRAILGYAAEELELEKVYLRTSRSNLPSQKLAEKLGLLKVESITEYKVLLYCGLLTF